MAVPKVSDFLTIGSCIFQNERAFGPISESQKLNVLPPASRQQFLLVQTVAVDANHRLTEIPRNLRQVLRILIEQNRLNNGLSSPCKD